MITGIQTHHQKLHLKSTKKQNKEIKIEKYFFLFKQIKYNINTTQRSDIANTVTFVIWPIFCLSCYIFCHFYIEMIQYSY